MRERVRVQPRSGDLQMRRRARRRLTYANAMATVAVFIALGGVSWAAATLPRHSVGPKQLRANAVTSSKVRNHALRARDFKAGQLPPGARGPQGQRGPTGAPGAGGKPGVAGQTGPRGPGTISFDGQASGSIRIPISNDLVLEFNCQNVHPHLDVDNTDPTGAFYGWGTAFDGTTLTHVSSTAFVEVLGTGSTADLDVVAHGDTQPGQPVEYTRIDASIVKRGQCTYHALVPPPA